MKALTDIERKTNSGQNLTKADLLFLYEVDAQIEGFGYQRDPRIEELRRERNPEEDMLVIFECTASEIARTPDAINQNTKAYLGKLEPNIFDKIQQYHIEHIYTSFPEGRIRKDEVEIGGQTAEALQKELEKKNIHISDYARDMLEKMTISKNLEQLQIIRLKVRDMGFERGVTTDEIYRRAEELGLELCPPETGPHYRLKYQNQPLGEYVWIGMKQIADRDGNPFVFVLERDEDGLWLHGPWAVPPVGGILITRLPSVSAS